MSLKLQTAVVWLQPNHRAKEWVNSESLAKLLQSWYLPSNLLDAGLSRNTGHVDTQICAYLKYLMQQASPAGRAQKMLAECRAGSEWEVGFVRSWSGLELESAVIVKG